MQARGEVVANQVERILHSEVFRNAEGLRRLLRYLADKSLAGEAEQLKEYAVGIDAFGKPPTYDPRQDSVVRIQVGRLRQKLEDYYRSEGKDDPILITLPKGRFKLTWEERPAEPAVVPPGEAESGNPRFGAGRRPAALTAIAAVALVWAAVASVAWILERQASARFRAARTPELEELWRPFLDSGRPTVVSVSVPLFVAIQGAGLYRDLTLNRWEDVENSPKVEAVRKALGATSIFPRYDYTGAGTVHSVFQLGRLLALTDISVSVARSSQISWQQMADSNVVLVGGSRTLSERLAGLPVTLPIQLEERGVRNSNPPPGQPAFLADNFPPMVSGAASGQPDDGEIYAVVTHAPGPLGTSRVRSFMSNHSPGTLGAVQSFTNAAWAKAILQRLRETSGRVPEYYQAVLKVTYKDTVPTEVSYVLHREIKASPKPEPPTPK